MEDWTYETAPDLDQNLVDRLKGFPRQPQMSIYFARCSAALTLRTWLRVYHRYKVEGRENLPPATESFVLIANHASHLDALCLLSSLPIPRLHKAFPAAAADYFFSSVPRSLFSATVINALPFERQAKGGQSLNICRELLANPGNVLIIFPEGTRSLDGTLNRFRSGVARLVVGTNVPVVPAWLDGAAAAWPKGAAMPRPRLLKLRIGAPRYYEDYEDNRESVREIVTDLQEAVEDLQSESSH